MMANFAASGLALTGATGGMRWTRLFSDGMSQTGSDSVPAKGEPRSVVENLMPESRLLRYVLKAGVPHSAQQAIRMIQGSHA